MEREGTEGRPFAFSCLGMGGPQTKPDRAQGLISSRNRKKHHMFLKVTDSCLVFPETWQVVCHARSHCLADLPPPTESQGQFLGSLGWGGRVGSHLGTSVLIIFEALRLQGWRPWAVFHSYCISIAQGLWEGFFPFMVFSLYSSLKNLVLLLKFFSKARNGCCSSLLILQESIACVRN